MQRRSSSPIKSDNTKETAKAIATTPKTKPPKSARPFWSPVPALVFTVFVFLAAQFIAAVVLGALFFLGGQTDGAVWDNTLGAHFLYTLLASSGVMLMLWGLLHIRSTTFRDIGLSWPRLRDVGYAVLGLGVYLLIYIVVAMIVQLAIPAIDFTQEQYLGGFKTASGIWQLMIVFISLVLLPPFIEEVLMRGFLYTGLKTKWPVWLAAVVTSLIFAAAHLQLGSNMPLLWVAAIDTFILSLVLIYLREKTGKLGASILLHMFKNAIAFVLLFIIVV